MRTQNKGGNGPGMGKAMMKSEGEKKISKAYDNLVGDYVTL